MEKTSQAKRSNKSNRKSESKSASKKAESKNTGMATAGAQSDNPQTEDKLTAIRELLFGEQVNRINEDVAESVAKLGQQIANLETKLDDQVSTIQAAIEKLTNALHEQMEKIDCEHQSAESILEQHIEDLDKRHQALIDDADNQIADTKKALDNQGKMLEKQIQQEVDKLTKLINKRASELGDNKADRKTLAALLETVASNLTENPA